MKARMGALAMGLLASVFVLAGLFLLYGALSNILKTHQASSWPTTTAAVTAVALKRSAGSKRPTYQADVRYTYRVSGQSCTGSTLSIGYGGSSDLSAHEALVRKLESARTVEVRYNPNAPAESVLMPGISRAHWFFLALALTWLLVVGGITTTVMLGLQADAAWLDRLVVIEGKAAR